MINWATQTDLQILLFAYTEDSHSYDATYVGCPKSAKSTQNTTTSSSVIFACGKVWFLELTSVTVLSDH